MSNKTLLGVTALVLMACGGARLAWADASPAQPHAVISAGGDATRPKMAHGTDLLPCKPGQHSEFSRRSGGYRCMRNP